jgi:hypothetical protein
MRSFAGMALAVALCAAVTVVASAPSQAATGDLTCTASAQANLKDPLTGAGTSALDITGALSDCRSPNGSWSSLLSASVTGTGTVTAQGGLPCDLQLTITGTATLAWSPGGPPNSVLDVTFSTVGTVTIAITVTHGPLAGDTVTVVPTVHPNPDCATAGLKSLTSEATAAVFS